MPDYSDIEHGFDTLPMVVGTANQPLDGLLVRVDAFMRPADFEVRVRELAKLRVRTVSRAQDGMDAQLMLESLADCLAEYPADVFAEACRKWSRREKWFPSESELRAECDRLFKKRKKLAESLRAAQSAAEAERLADVLGAG